MTIDAPVIAPRQFDKAEDVLSAIKDVYAANVTYLRKSFDAFTQGNIPKNKVRACYPYIKIVTTASTPHRADTRKSYGFLPKEGSYITTLTRPDIFECYYKEQIELLLENHDTPIEVGVSETPIPLHFGLGEDFFLEGDLTKEQIKQIPILFDQPNLGIMDDKIPNGTFVVREGEDMPLALFTAPRVDLSLMRLKHYTATSSKHFQNYVIFTNYQFYIDEFVKIGHSIMEDSDVTDPEYIEFVEPGDKIVRNKNIPENERLPDEEGQELRRMPQMPTYHLKRKDGSGITMVNIGVGPSNAKNITDHIAVLRPHAWLMLGHCAGLRNSQELGDYVLAHGYYRDDNVLYKDLHPSIPVPALAEVQIALEHAVSEVTGLHGYDLKKVMRTGTVATIDDRNWELRSSARQNIRFSQSRAIALDMESGTIAANGFRFRVPYGTLLCVSDRPLHGELKLPGMAENFYRQRVEQHLQIGLLTMALLREIPPERLHSRKLRSFNEVAFL